MERVTKLQEENGKNKFFSGEKKNGLDEQALEIYSKQGLKAMEEFLKKKDEREKARKESAAQEKKPDKSPGKSGAGDSPAPTPVPVPDITSGAGDLSDNIQDVIRKSPVDRTVTPTETPRSVMEALMLLQPKSVILGTYSLTAWQLDALNLIMDQLQGYMSRSTSLLRKDFIGNLTVRIDSSVIASDDKKKALEQIEKLMDVKFEFWWQSKNAPAGTSQIQTKGVIVNTIHNFVGTPYVDIVINSWAIPALVYIGKGNGAGLSNKRVFLQLRGKYAKRLYNILSAYSDKGMFDYRIDMMRKNFMIPPGYSNATIKRSIIEPAVEEINATDEKMEISFEFIALDSGGKGNGPKPKGKREFDTIRFKIREKKTGLPPVSEREMVEEVVAGLSPHLDEPYRSSLRRIAEKWRNHGNITLVYSKVRYYTEQARAGRMTQLKARNYMIKAIEEETGTSLRKTRRRKVRDNQDNQG